MRCKLAYGYDELYLEALKSSLISILKAYMKFNSLQWLKKIAMNSEECLELGIGAMKLVPTPTLPSLTSLTF